MKPKVVFDNKIDKTSARLIKKKLEKIQNLDQ